MSVLGRDKNREHTSTVRSIVPKIPNIVQVIEALNKGVRKFPGDTNETAHIHIEKYTLLLNARHSIDNRQIRQCF